jgi:hypothetical protein
MSTNYLLRQDAMGWKVAELASDDSYDGQTFTLSTGEKVGKEQGWIANPENLLSLAQHKKLKPPEELSMPELEGQELVRFLGKLGYCLDHDWRVRRFMREPFTKVRALDVVPIITGHIQVLKEEQAQKIPITLGWFEGKVGMIQPGQVLIMPEKMPEGMPVGDVVLIKTSVKGTPDTFRLALKFQDWFAIPKEQAESQPVCTLELMQFIPEDRVIQTGTDSVEEFLGKDRFLTPEGLVVNRGSMLTISIDDFLKNMPPPEDGKGVGV